MNTVSRHNHFVAYVAVLVMALVMVLSPMATLADNSNVISNDRYVDIPSLESIAGRGDVVLDSGATLTDYSTGCLKSDLLGKGQNVKGTDGNSYWAGAIRLWINDIATPVFCIDLYNHTGSGDCFQALGPTSEAVTWLLNNYPPDFSLTTKEAAARQAAVWYFSDGFAINPADAVAARANEIIKSVPQPVNLPLNPPTLSISPSNVISFLPDQTVTFTLTAMQDGLPAAGLSVGLATTFGTLSVATVTTNAAGQATFTLTSSAAGSATVTAKALFNLPRGTELWYTGTGRRQTLVLGYGTSGYVYANAGATWKAAGSIVAHKFGDLNLNGYQDGRELSLSGWTMKLYTQQTDGTFVYANKQGNTDASGNYTFTGLQAGTYQVRETMQDGWMATTATEQAVVLATGSGAQVNFGNVQLAVVTVVKFRDDNLNGIYESFLSEPTLDGWRITLWKQVDGSWADQGSAWTSGGAVNFSALTPGTYKVEETMQAGWINSTATAQTFVLGAGDNKVVYVGNVQDICQLSGPSTMNPGEEATLYLPRRLCQLRLASERRTDRRESWREHRLARSLHWRQLLDLGQGHYHRWRPAKLPGLGDGEQSDPDADQYTDEHADQYTDQYADEHADQYAD